MLFVVVLVNFGLPVYSANEASERAEVDVHFSNPSSTDITVQVTNRDISASSRGMYFMTINLLFSIHILAGVNIDYDPGPYTITFPPGRVNSSLTIPITDDIILEENEIFNITVRVTSALILSRVATGDLSQVTVNILDNDRMLYYVIMYTQFIYNNYHFFQL